MKNVEGSEVAIIIPARNEEGSIGFVLEGILSLGVVSKDQIYVSDNDSTDKTNEVAKSYGVHVVHETELGYGNACLRALKEIASLQKLPGAVVVCDGDGSDFPEDILSLVETLNRTQADLVIGSRTIGEIEENSLGFLQRFGNWLTCFLILVFYRKNFSDLGPLRAIRYESLLKMKLKDPTWGWNIEMHIRALQENMKVVEIPVGYRRRKSGVSKISGTLRMAVRVGIKILYTFFKLTFFKPK
ncbi:glycosyltransferase family 2 protein [Leptospira idonii]|uniref:Glycosyltransferase family 2 protein n=1 Tax=Leptospira idonii TaxID=1193500 RepID=A0A4R9M628_9LEPT|nr:glycosyltransferase family 2 protein [Leptospira idonii]TGN21127.1 glycosyltransferase family 2 protein [Leptospira idonii]